MKTFHSVFKQTGTTGSLLSFHANVISSCHGIASVWLRCVAFAVALSANQLAAQETGHASVRFVVEIDAAIKGAKPGSSALSGKSATVPYEHAFVYIPATKYVRKTAAKQWLLNNREAATPKQHRFEFENGELRPLTSIARVNDTIHLLDDETTPLGLEMISNSPTGPSPDVMPNLQLRSSEPLPIRILMPISKAEAHMLVLDHAVAAVTDERGIAHFKKLPTGMVIPMRIACPRLQQQDLSITSPSLDIADNGTFYLSIEGEQPVQHRILLSPRH